MSLETLFVQKVIIDGEEIGLGYILELTYVESSDIDGSRLIILMSDMDGDVRDSLGLAFGSELDVTLGDVLMDDGSQFVDKFTVVSDPKRDGDTLLVECMHSTIYALKQKTVTPRFFVDKSPRQILDALIQDKPVEINDVVGRGTYHLQSGTTKSQLIKQMCKEIGARFYYCRGTYYLESYSYINNKDITAELEYKNSRAYHAIWRLKLPFSGSLVSRERVKTHCYFDMKRGLKVIGSGNELVMGNNIGEANVKNLNKHFVPKLRFEMRGTTVFKPTDKVKIKVHRFHQERVLDESIPDEQSIIELIHFQKGYTYVCQANTGVVESA